jgi:molybdopterin-guanine dinucleotide biosynthesis protein A
MRLAAIILAGGRGTRFGSSLKCLSQLPRLTSTLRRAGCTRIVVAGDHDGLDSDAWLRVPDAMAGSGPLSGIVAGLAACADCQAAIIVPGDQLHLSRRDIIRLLAAWRQHHRPAVAAQTTARRQQPARTGIFGLLPAHQWPLAVTRLARNQLSVFRLWRAAKARPVWFSAAELADLDRPDDLLKFRAGRRR